jgi:hypothetical protein
MGGGGMGGGGMGGGGFFSVDSSLIAGQEDAADSATGDGAQAPGPSSEDSAEAPASEGAENIDTMGDSGMAGASGMPGPGPPPPATPLPTIYQFKHFVAIVHSALAVLLGLAGGVIAQIFYARRESPAAN